MTDRNKTRKTKKEEFNSEVPELIKVLQVLFGMLKSEDKEKIYAEVTEISVKRCFEDTECWQDCVKGKRWYYFRIKEILNFLNNRGVTKYQVGPLTQVNLFEIAKILKLEADPHKIEKTILWPQIVEAAKIKQVKDKKISETAA
ncbi:hypothetical protein KKF47_01635 [Patescibacteria group bacterium]|nr:hypothetical protein [Patescibacteria group bacterium]